MTPPRVAVLKGTTSAHMRGDRGLVGVGGRTPQLPRPSSETPAACAPPCLPEIARRMTPVAQSGNDSAKHPTLASSSPVPSSVSLSISLQCPQGPPHRRHVLTGTAPCLLPGHPGTRQRGRVLSCLPLLPETLATLIVQSGRSGLPPPPGSKGGPSTQALRRLD